ncbi:MAG: CHAT domain-containing protein [Phaeodactylibacter sp.]|nr:CHAT domain-containing protein [Phaeodactylibacter sp.]
MRTNILLPLHFALLAILLYACPDARLQEAPVSAGSAPPCEAGAFRSLDSFDCEYDIQLPEAIADKQPLMQYIARKNKGNKVGEVSADTILLMDSVLQYLAENDHTFEYSHFVLLFSKADWLHNNGRPAESRHYLRLAIDLSEQEQENWQDTCMWVIQGALFNRASLVYTELHERDNGLAYTKAAIRLYEKLGLQGEVANGYANIGYALQISGEPAEAIAAHQKALCIYSNIPKLHYMDSVNQAWVYNNLAHTYSIFGDSLEVRAQIAGARAYWEKSLRLYKNNQFLVDSTFEQADFVDYQLYTSLNIAYMYTRMPGPASADSIRHYIRQTEAFLNPEDEMYPYFQAILIRHLAHADVYEGNWEEGLAKISQALRLLVKGTAQDGSLLIEHKRVYLDFLLVKAKLLKLFAEQHPDDPGPWVQCLEAYLRAFDFLEGLRKELSTDASLESVIKPRLKHYGDAFDAARRLHVVEPKQEYLEAAFEILERCKGFTLEQSIYRRLEQLEKNAKGSGYLQRELAYRQEIRAAEIDLIENKSVEKEKKLRLAKERFSRFIDTLKLTPDPAARAFYHNRLKEELPSVAEVRQQVLDNQSAAVSYLIGNRRLFALLITKNTAIVTSTDIDSTFFDLIADFQNSLRGEQGYAYYTNRAKALYQATISMLEPHLPPGVSQLIVIPDKQLAQVPFGALLADAPEEKSPYNELAYFADKYDLAYHSSFNSFLGSRKLERLRSIAPSRFGGFIANMPNPDKGIASCGGFELTALNAQVTDTYRQYFSAQSPPPFQRVSKTAFIKEAGNFDLIQLSLHGCSQNQGNRSFYLEFQPDSKNDDGILSLPEIYNLNLRARLAVLSNCQTAEGAYIYGEGVMSISRAFYYAGCTRIIATTNPVLSQATADVLTLFYGELTEKGLPPHQALANAQRSYYRNKNAYPRNWANLLYFGDILPLTSEQVGSNLR